MLETWVAVSSNRHINSYNFIRDEGSHYRVSVMERDIEDDVFLSIYHVEISDIGIRIIEIQ